MTLLRFFSFGLCRVPPLAGGCPNRKAGRVPEGVNAQNPYSEYPDTFSALGFEGPKRVRHVLYHVKKQLSHARDR
jgi:hypothetical protein